MAQAPRISTLDREATFEELERRELDCVVIGGGITGAGVAHEAAQRGLSVALFEAADFAAGTSSRSSKLIHGGLRYLAMGEVMLVREMARERKVIHRMAPHLAEPRWVVVPTRSRPGLMKFRAAIGAYETLGAVEDADQHRNWSSEDLEREEPLFRSSIYPWACVYREYVTDDARLVLANLRGAMANGALVVNHAPVEAVVVEGGRAAGVEATCRLSGRRVRVRARCVINAAGPWVDAVRCLEDAGAPPMLHLSKGIHLVLRAQRVGVRNVLILGAPDGRSIFMIPRGEIVYVGTTDTSYPGGVRIWPEINSDDVEYLLEPLPRYLDVEPVKPEEVVAAWAGLRPLVAEEGRKPTDISRKDEILVGPAGVVTIAGGKLTGYRQMAHRSLEKAEEVTGLELGPAFEEEPPLPGGDFDGDLDRLSARLIAERRVPEWAAVRLARLYGTEALELLGNGFEPLVSGQAAAAQEVDWAVTHEGAATVEDVLYRRTRLALYDPDARAASVEPVAGRLADLLGWDEARRAREVEAARARLAEELAFARGGGA
jgi:glycerol-3-phosphate dehydrogenase